VPGRVGRGHRANQTGAYAQDNIKLTQTLNLSLGVRYDYDGPLSEINGLLTNFHQPRSSLLVMLDAFVGAEHRRSAYQHALATGYRFLSFGDCMLCWR